MEKRLAGPVGKENERRPGGRAGVEVLLEAGLSKMG